MKLKSLEENYIREDNELKERHDKLINEYKIAVSQQLEGIVENHRVDMDELTQSLTAKAKDFIVSKELINLRLSEKNLVKQERFFEAQQVKDQIVQLESSLSEARDNEREKTIKKKCEQLALKQTEEVNIFKSKINSQLKTLDKGKDSEVAMLHLKFKMKKVELEGHHKKNRYLNENTNLLKASFILSKELLLLL